MKAWGQVEGRRIEASGEGGGGAGAARPSLYGGVDWWPDCGLGQEAVDRHAARGQRACRLCLEGVRRREQERIEAETGRPMPDDIVRRQLASLVGPRAPQRYGRPMSPCGTEGAKRRHARHGETCEACGVRDGRSTRGRRGRS